MSPSFNLVIDLRIESIPMNFLNEFLRSSTDINTSSVTDVAYNVRLLVSKFMTGKVDDAFSAGGGVLILSVHPNHPGTVIISGASSISPICEAALDKLLLIGIISPSVKGTKSSAPLSLLYMVDLQGLLHQ